MPIHGDDSLHSRRSQQSSPQSFQTALSSI